MITQGFTFIATFEAIIESGAVPIPTEIDDTLNMDPLDFEKKITDKTKAVIPVHMLGAPARIQEIIDIARKHGVKVPRGHSPSHWSRSRWEEAGDLGRYGHVFV